MQRLYFHTFVNHLHVRLFFSESCFNAFFRCLVRTSEDVVTELEDFCKGYREGKAEVWVELLALDVEKVMGNAGAAALIATMNHMKIKHGHLNKART